MKIYETLARDPRTTSLANSGQARITTEADDRAIAELRAELETFVCDGEYGLAIEKILGSFLKNMDRPRQDAAWVSGFFGSGKSHLLKMLGHLWVDTPFSDGATARSLVHGLSDEILALLRELDTQVARSRLPAVACAGTLPAGSGDFVKMTVLSVILHARGLPEQYPQVRFCFWLKDQGHYDKVRQAVEDAGKEWLKELNNLYVSGVIASAVLSCDPNFATDEKEARKTIRETFPNLTQDITTEEFLQMARQALAVGGELPLTIVVLDEVQQYIGDSTDRAVAITEVTEAIYSQLDSKVMLVASGQASLSASPLLQKLKDRYRINAPLSDTDVEAVTRKVVLRKNPDSVAAIKALLDKNAGEVDKQLASTRLASRPEDQRTIVADYPLLPTRRRFFEECFRAVDAAGTHSQLRSQLRILHDSLGQIAERELGAVIPADALFDAIAPNLVQTGVLLNEIDLRIRSLNDGTEAGKLKSRACGLVFLISKLPRETGMDSGVEATARTIADLLVEDITEDSGPFRKKVETALEELAASGALMKVGEEYRLQTTEGAEWERAFREKVGVIRGNDAEIEHRRSQLLGAAVQAEKDKIRLLHGESKERRTLHLHLGQEDPTADGDHVVVWLRDGWSTPQKDVESEARRRGQEDSVIHVFLPRKSADELTVQIAETEASRKVMDIKGVPSTPEGREAMESMRSRNVAAEQKLTQLVGDITAAARVYQGGGSEVFGDTLEKKLQTAAEASLARLFNDFPDGDHKSWGVAVKRAREGNDTPLKIVGWDGPTEDHPVVKMVVAKIGNGAKGSEIRKELQASPFGWPRDAIDAALIALHRNGTIRADLNGQAVVPGQLDQNKISTASFVPEKVLLSASDKLALRGLFQKAGLTVLRGEEEAKAAVFLDVLGTLANKAGGEPPLPHRPSAVMVDKLSSLHGSEQLGAILEKKDELETSIASWTKTSELIEARQPGWELLQKLHGYTSELPVHAEIAPQMEAIRTDRSLVDETDHVSPLVKDSANALRAAITEQATALKAAYDAGLGVLDADPSWKELKNEERELILKSAGLAPPVAPVTKTDEDVLRELDRLSLEARASAVAAVPTRTAQALEEAARSLRPEAKRVRVRTATLPDEKAVREWIEEQEKMLLDAVAEGPVIVS